MGRPSSRLAVPLIGAARRRQVGSGSQDDARAIELAQFYGDRVTRHWASDGIVANAVNPGGVATGLQRNFSARQRESLDAAAAAGVFRYKTIEQGAATTLVAAVAPEFAHTGGHYLDECREAYTVGNDAELAQHPHGVKAWALDTGAAERLWSVSTNLVFA